jgi:hypothetical protein
MAQKKTATKAPKVSKVPVTDIEPGRRPRSARLERNDHLVTVNGKERYLTPMAIETAIQRGDNVELPKDSRITIPPYLQEKSNCRGCGS